MPYIAKILATLTGLRFVSRKARLSSLVMLLFVPLTNAQLVRIDFKVHFVFPTNGSGYLQQTVSLAGVTKVVAAQYPCAPIDTPVLTARLETNRTYELFYGKGNQASFIGTAITFLNPPCNLSVEGGCSNCSTNDGLDCVYTEGSGNIVAYDNNGWDADYLTWGVSISQAGRIEFKSSACGGTSLTSLSVADRTAYAFPVGRCPFDQVNCPYLGRVDWWIEGDALGCQLMFPFTERGNFVNAVTRGWDSGGTIRVRAAPADHHECYYEGVLELIPPPPPNIECFGDATVPTGQSGNTPPGVIGPPGRPPMPHRPPVCMAWYDSEGRTHHLPGQNVLLGVSLGQSAQDDAQSAGMLLVKPTVNPPSTSDLAYLWKRDDVELIPISSDNGAIKQVRSHDGLVDVSVPPELDGKGYKISIYAAKYIGGYSQSGYSIIDNSPTIATVAVENPDAPDYPATNHIRVTETRPEGTGVYDYYWITNNGCGWEVTYPSNAKKERLLTSLTTNANPERTVTRTILTSNSQVVLATSHKFETFSFGERLVSAATGTGADMRTNGYSYYTNGLVKSETRFDGYWQWFFYDEAGRPTQVFSSVKTNQAATTNRTLCRLIEYDYSTNAVNGSGDDGTEKPASPRQTREYLFGQLVSLHYAVFLPGKSLDVQCLSTNAAWNSASNLISTNWYITNGLFYGKLWRTQPPDGTVVLYQYSQTFDGSSYVATNYTTNVVLVGKPDASGTNIAEGTKTITVAGPVGETLMRTTLNIGSSTNTITEQEIYSSFDEFNRARATRYLDGTSNTVAFDCCGLSVSTNREGTISLYSYDALKRMVASWVSGIGVTYSNIFDEAGQIIATLRQGTDGTLITNEQRVFDSGGKLVQRIDALNHVTQYSETNEPSGLRIVTTTQLTNATAGVSRIEKFNPDGTLQSVSGGAVHPVRYEYGPTNSGTFKKEIKLNPDGSDSGEWLIEFMDLVGRNYKVVYADGSFSQTFYNASGQRVKQVDPDGVTTLYQYNGRGEMESTALSANRGDTIDFANDRITRNVSVVTNTAHGDVLLAQTYVWATNGSTNGTLVSSVERSTDGLRSWQSQWGVTNSSQTCYAGSGARYETNRTPDGSSTVSYSLYGRLQSVTRKDAGGQQLSQTSYGYDPHGRQSTVTDARNGTSTFQFDAQDRITNSISPDPGPNGDPQTTTTFYDSLGRVWRTVLPDNTSVTNEWFDTGELKKTSGSRTFPVEYTYDHSGRIKTMKTWQNFASDQGAALTTWNYTTDRGFLQNKRYNDNTGPAYTYTAAGKLKTRTWARNIVTTYETNSFGDIVRVTYNDGVTAGVTNAYDRLGRAVGVTNGPNVLTRAYDLSGILLSETFNGVMLSNRYDVLLRRTNLALNLQPSTLNLGYDYDSASRLHTVSAGDVAATYSYLANSPLVEQIAFAQSNATRMTTTKSYDYLNRLTKIETLNAQLSTLNSFAYAYNSANQRTNITLGPDGSYWRYEYDNLGQVKSGKKYWRDGTPVAGQQFEYTFDDIGNRKQTKAGGDASGAGLRSAAYTNNLLNQITCRDVPGTNDITGLAHASASVTVNGQSPYRKGEYYWKDLAATNAVGVAWDSVTNQAVLAGSTNTVIGGLLTARRGQSFWHDADGNLLSDGVWTNTWDAENRITASETVAAVPTGGKAKETWSYYGDGRWSQRVISTWNGSAWVPQATNRFVWDGLILTALADHTNGLIQAFVRGLDLSGSLQGAGGTGGLLALVTATNGTHFYCFDGNGNVAALVKAADETVSARYEYGPFGESIRMTGPMATVNLMRFSSQFADDVTGDIKYLYRGYTASTGRWLNRDPIGELGFETLRRKRSRVNGAGGNLYGFVGNNPLNAFDVFGLYEYEWEGNFSDAEKQAIQNSIGRVKDRANALIKQMDDNIKALKKCPCPAYDDLAKKLEGLKKVLQGMVKEIDDPGWNLEIYKESSPGVDATYWDSPVPWFDDKLTLDPGWFGHGASGQDSTMFHEISHGQGTDDATSNDYNNAHLIEGLMHTDKENWIIFKKDKKDADKKCNPAGK